MARVKGLALALALISFGSWNCSRSTEQVFVIYSPHGKDQLSVFEKAFEQAHPGVDVQWLDMGSQEILDRIRSEKSNPQADLWWGAPSSMFARAARENLLEPYRPSWHDKVGKESRGAADFWYGTYLTPEVIVYNSSALKREQVPADWDQVVDPRWKGKIILRDPVASGTMQTIFASILLRSEQQQGSLEPGYEWLRKLDANNKEYVLNPTLLYQKLARQEALLSLWNLTDIELQRERYQYPLDYVIPSSGTPLVAEGLALVRGARRLELARQFYEWCSNEPNMLLAAEKFYRIPSRRDLPPDKLPAWLRRAMSQMRIWDLDARAIEEKSETWMQYWDTHIRGQGHH